MPARVRPVSPAEASRTVPPCVHKKLPALVSASLAPFQFNGLPSAHKRKVDK